jgi:hypothetical protein
MNMLRTGHSCHFCYFAIDTTEDPYDGDSEGKYSTYGVPMGKKRPGLLLPVYDP